MSKHAKNERHRLLRVLYEERQTLPLPINNQEIHFMEQDGLITVSAPRRHRQYQVVDLALTADGYAALEALERSKP